MRSSPTPVIILVVLAVALPGRAEDRHWSFGPMKAAPVPVTQSSDGALTPLDAFVAVRLREAGLTPNGPADPATLLRRVHFDVVGLPPSPQDVSAFLADDSPDAYERRVDRLLASPGYGERWGRHWLDLARYADSGGFHNDIDRPDAWRYRDYVIDSFNADKPYARFVREQLAGDELPDASAESWIATGFGRNGPSNEDNMGATPLAREKYRLDELDDVISTTANVFLGLTIGCARCHDHKYDPIPIDDYYRFLAFFDGVEKQRLALDDFAPDRPALKPSGGKPDPSSPAAMVLSDRGRKPRTTHVLYRGDPANVGPAVGPGLPGALAGIELDPPSTNRRSALADWIVDVDNPLAWRVMANRVWQHHFGTGLVATPSNFGKLGQRPSHPELLDRLALDLRDAGGPKAVHRSVLTSATYQRSSHAGGANHAIDPDNRWLWRAAQRRLEAEPLRDAILAASGALNRQMGGPGIKPRVRPDLLEASQRNKWPVVKQEGPEHRRRSTYVYIKRQLPYPMLALFDAPDAAHSCDRREESLVPTQSLVLMNDESIHEQAALFAARSSREAGPDPEARVRHALFVALGREPAPARVAEGVAFVAAQERLLAAEGRDPAGALADFCHVLMNLNEFAYVE